MEVTKNIGKEERMSGTKRKKEWKWNNRRKRRHSGR